MASAVSETKAVPFNLVFGGTVFPGNVQCREHGQAGAVLTVLAQLAVLEDVVTHSAIAKAGRSHILPPSEMKSLYGSMISRAVVSLSNFRLAMLFLYAGPTRARHQGIWA